MFGRTELNRLDLRKQALVLESDLNRFALQAEFRNLHSATTWVGELTQKSRGFAPLLLVLAPLAGFLLSRGSRQAHSWLSRVSAAAKWAIPLYRLWKSYSASQAEKEAATPPH